MLNDRVFKNGFFDNLPTYRKWPQLLVDTKNCIYQKLENVVIPGITSKYQANDYFVIP